MSHDPRTTRRQLLRGAAGFTLALPLLPSLLSRAAEAQVMPTRRPRLVWFGTDHGGAFEANMFPAASLLTQHQDYVPGHAIASGTLRATTQGSDAVISPILRAAASTLRPSLVAKMNVLHGLDVPWYIAHNTGGHLGNFARNDGNGGEGRAVQAYPRPTADQLLAWSTAFYPDLRSVRERAMVINPGRALSWSWSDPLAKAGAIQNVRGFDSSLSLFDAVFDPNANLAAGRRPVVDRVLASYQSLRQGNRRLSQADRQRLDDHMQRLSELQRRLDSPLACGAPGRPTDDASHHGMATSADAIAGAQLFSDVVVAAFACGASSIAVHGIGSTERYADFHGDWHQDVAHQWQLPDKQALLVTSYQKFFEHVMLDLATKLDVEESPGVTYLDNSLLVWSQECGMETHSSLSSPIVTLGSAAGFLRTGQFVDYRNVLDPQSRHGTDSNPGGAQYAGVLYTQWLATVLRAMRVAPADFELWGYKGFGYPYLGDGNPWTGHYQNTSSPYFQRASDVLPFLAG